MRILVRRNEFVYINTCVLKHKGHVSSASQNIFWMFSHSNLSETSLEFTSVLEFEFVIVISIRDSNLLTHVLKIRHYSYFSLE